MIWLWRIFFSLILLWPAAGATVSGRVSLSDSPVSAAGKRQDCSGVVVWLEPASAAPPAAAPERAGVARVIQKDKRFIPHVLAIQVGTAVAFPNLDPIYHSAFSTFSGQIFDLGLYPPGTSRTVAFRHAGIVRVFCNIHPAMSAVIVVLKDPWFAVSNATGAFSIPGVPAGEYRMRVFHERAARKILDALERRVTAGGGDLAIPSFTISCMSKRRTRTNTARITRPCPTTTPHIQATEMKNPLSESHGERTGVDARRRRYHCLRRCRTGLVVVTVSDTGPGIAPEIRSRLFQPFVTARKKSGPGLRLALARQAVVDHGGDMWADFSESGASFLFRLPSRRGHEAQPEAGES
jgi:plastocyanin